MNYTPPESMTFSNACVYVSTYARKHNTVVNFIIFNISIMVLPTESPLTVAKKAIKAIEAKVLELQAQKETLNFAGRYKIAEQIDLLNDYIKL